MNKIAFLDRDGIINIDYGHVHKKDKFVFQKGIFELCHKLMGQDYLLVVVTNQAGIAKGIYSLEDFNNLNNYMEAEFVKRGVKISAVYFCPHQDSDFCNCRKPKPELFKRALSDFNGDARVSLAIGDKIEDLIAAHAAGVAKLYFLQGSYPLKQVDFQFQIISDLQQIDIGIA